ncbi:MAG: zinc ribbon domain-containing protein [Mogibacterium sp.]|nr:zinc ribbon domain-containing protein [Mogibacterium sp.]
MLKSNYLIINRKAQPFDRMRVAGRAAVFLGESGSVLDHGVLKLDESVYTALYCDAVRNMTLVLDFGEYQRVVTLLWTTEAEYRRGWDTLQEALAAAGIRVSPQDWRINRYAEAIAEKLSIGVRLRVTDAVDKAGMIACPACSTLNPAGSEFCLDCGEDL